MEVWYCKNHEELGYESGCGAELILGPTVGDCDMVKMRLVPMESEPSLRSLDKYEDIR